MGEHVQSISGFASGASCDAGRPRLLSVSASSCPSMRRGVPALWCRREGRGRAGVRGLQGSRSRRLETFQVRRACSLMQVGDERGGLEVKTAVDKGDRMTQTTHATTKPISQLTFPLRRHPIYQPAQEHRISSMQVQLNSWGSQPCPRLYVCYVGESNNLKQLPTNQPSTPNIKYSRYVCVFLGMQAQKTVREATNCELCVSGVTQTPRTTCFFSFSRLPLPSPSPSP